MNQAKSDLKNQNRKRSKIRLIVISVVALLFLPIIVGGLWYSYLVFAITPSNIAYPKLAHHHFRMQIIIDGKYIDLSQPEFQEEYTSGICSADLTETPIHLHDNKDQFVHIHWAKITGGQVLKYYGLNQIGGSEDIMGYQANAAGHLWPKALPVRGQLLPDLSSQQKMWIYSGDENSYQLRSSQDFLDQDLETFFGVQSSLSQAQESSYNFLFSLPALAHSGSTVANNDESNNTSESPELSQQELKELNNLLGNVVIFIQAEAPTDQQIRDRFNSLVPLEKSTCGG